MWTIFCRSSSRSISLRTVKCCVGNPWAQEERGPGLIDAPARALRWDKNPASSGKEPTPRRDDPSIEAARKPARRPHGRFMGPGGAGVALLLFLPGEQAEFDGSNDRLGAVGDPELGDDVRYVGLDRGSANPQLSGNLLVGPP